MRCSACGSRKVHTAPELHPGGVEALRERRSGKKQEKAAGVEPAAVSSRNASINKTPGTCANRLLKYRRVSRHWSAAYSDRRAMRIGGTAPGAGRTTRGGPSEQLWHPDEVVGRHRQREAVAHAGKPSDLDPADAGNGLRPAERFLDLLAPPLARGIGRMPMRL
jgi:hypothetical protein